MKNKSTIWVVSILIIIAVGIGGWFVINSYSKSGNTTNNQNTVAGLVNIQNFNFNPGTITVNKGDTVTWKNNDSMIHRVIADDNSFDLGNMTQNDTSKHIFDTVGTFSYHCAIHPSMTGTVIVK